GAARAVLGFPLKEKSFTFLIHVAAREGIHSCMYTVCMQAVARRHKGNTRSKRSPAQVSAEKRGLDCHGVAARLVRPRRGTCPSVLEGV
ncbi:MAG: hypothetical protein ACPIOQ_10000, partial [Promethearchaeia archaeon]